MTTRRDVLQIGACVATSAAVPAGRDTLAWFQSLPAERQATLRAGLDPQKEADTLRSWHLSDAKG